MRKRFDNRKKTTKECKNSFKHGIRNNNNYYVKYNSNKKKDKNRLNNKD